MESLYRKYRPQTFEDVVGQTHVVSTLERAVTEGRTSHAYLFCGPRGTGKTTMARILAKALMCERGEHELPDGTCEECRLIAAGEHPDVYELDAASRTGVDNVREEIINRVDYAPVRGRYKVYIIDEVHMLTPAAFNALLKTLEEPPSHVVFIMCTTDPQKVLATILSRVQRFDFRSIGAAEMHAHLASICEREGFTYEDEALELVVRHAHGGMRDAISTLEQLSVFGDGAITAAAARDLLGEVSDSRIAGVSLALARRDVPTLFGEVAALVDGGRDLLQFTRELMARVRDVYVVSAAGALPGVVHATDDELTALGEEAAAYGGGDRLARVLTVLGDTANEMRTSVNQRLTLEVALTRIARPESDLTLEALAERLEALEARVASGAVSAPAATAGAGAPAPAATAAAAAPVAAPKPVAPAAGSDAHKFVPPPLVLEHKAIPRPAASSASSATSAPATSAAPTPVSPSPAPAAPVSPAPAPAPVPAPAAPAPAEPALSAPAANGNLQRMWKGMVDGLLKTNASCASLLLNAHAEQDDGATLTVSLPTGSAFTRRMLERADVKGIVDAAVTAAFGVRVLAYVEAGSADVAAASASAAEPSPAPEPEPKSDRLAPKEPAAPEPVPAPEPPAAPAPAPTPVAAAAPTPAPSAAPAAPAPAATPTPVPAPPDDDMPPYDDAYPAEGDEPAAEPVMPSAPVPAKAAALKLPKAPGAPQQPAAQAADPVDTPAGEPAFGAPSADEFADEPVFSNDEPVDVDAVSSMFNDVFGKTTATLVDEDNNPIS